MISGLDWLPSAEARGCSRDANSLTSSRQWKVPFVDWEMGFFW